MSFLSNREPSGTVVSIGMYVCMYNMSVCTYACVSMFVLCNNTCVCIYIYACMYVCMMYEDIRVCMHCTYVCVCVCVCVHLMKHLVDLTG